MSDYFRGYARDVGVNPPINGADNVQDALAASGATPGTAIVRAFPFTFDTPNLLTGAALYTPTINDVLLDAWVEIGTAWDGTTPLGDFGTFTAAATGVFGHTAGQAVPMDSADSSNNTFAGMLVGTSLSDARDMATLTTPTTDEGDGIYVVAVAAVNFIASPVSNGQRLFPARFTAADPIEFCVTQDGTNTGMDPGSTQGAGTLYLVTATPT